MKIKNSFLIGIALLTFSGVILQSYITKNDLPAEEIEVKEKSWTDIETAVKQAKTDQKKILVDVYTDWCKWCKVMDEKTFSDPEVSRFLEENFHLVKFNAEQKEAIKFNGKKFSFKSNGRRGYHEFAADALNGQLAYPSLVVYDSQLNKLEVIRGYKKAHELIGILKSATDS